MVQLDDNIRRLKRLPAWVTHQMKWSSTQRLLAQIPLFMFALSLCIASFAYGFIADRNHVFPYDIVKAAVKTGSVIATTLSTPRTLDLVGPSAVSAANVATHRITKAVDPARRDRYLLVGGVYQYLELCPQFGCLAVELDRDGKPIHAYPFKPLDLLNKIIASRPYEATLYDPVRDIYPVGVQMLADGGLIVTLQRKNSFPFAGGVARIAKDGTVIWYRQDYEHHWPALLGRGEIAVPTMNIRHGNLPVVLNGAMTYSLKCDDMYEDGIEILDLNGKVVDRFSVLQALLNSPWRHVLDHISSPCNPTHLNFVRAIGTDLAAYVPGSRAGDLLVSMNQPSAFGIIGRQDHKFKIVVRGNFFRQHNVVPIGGPKVILVDNWGGDRLHDPSQVKVYDFSTHTEQTVFPGPLTPPGILSFTEGLGHLDLSADGKRVVFAVTNQGSAYEFDLDTGRIVTKFDNL